jgi:dihydrolipoamide dehydrogenase
MDTRSVDVAVIGAGTAGLVARREAERNGASTVLIESGPYGTMCARVGCMPSKLLIAAADLAHEVSRAGEFGIAVPAGVRVDAAAVLERVRRERDRFAGFVIEDTEALPAEVRLRGRARFLGPTTLLVDDHTRVEARAIVIATGSRPHVPEIFDAVRDRVLVNDDVFELEDLPDSIAVIGSGVIGLELGQALHRLGVRVAIFSRSGHIGPLTDPEVTRSARDVLGAELDLRLDLGRDARFDLRADPAGGVRIGDEHFDRVLAATGRRPAVESLDLERAGVALDARGVPVHDARTGRAGDSAIFVAGDVTGDRLLLHEAADEGRIVGFNAAHPGDVRAHVRRTPLSVVFSDPQIALFGERFADLDRDRIAIGSVNYADQGRARVMGRNAGLVRVYADRRDGSLLGGEMFGPQVEHTAHLLAWVVGRGVDRILELPFYHPVVEEGIRTALRSAAHQLQLVPAPCAHELDCGPGV